MPALRNMNDKSNSNTIFIFYVYGTDVYILHENNTFKAKFFLTP